LEETENLIYLSKVTRIVSIHFRLQGTDKISISDLVYFSQFNNHP
jgi:hypothetical protein